MNKCNITHCVLPSRYYTSLLFGLIVMFFWSYGQKFGHLVFYLFGRPDQPNRSSSVVPYVVFKKNIIKFGKSLAKVLWHYLDFSFCLSFAQRHSPASVTYFLKISKFCETKLKKLQKINNK